MLSMKRSTVRNQHGIDFKHLRDSHGATRKRRHLSNPAARRGTSNSISQEAWRSEPRVPAKVPNRSTHGGLAYQSVDNERWVSQDLSRAEGLTVMPREPSSERLQAGKAHLEGLSDAISRICRPNEHRGPSWKYFLAAAGRRCVMEAVPRPGPKPLPEAPAESSPGLA